MNSLKSFLSNIFIFFNENLEKFSYQILESNKEFNALQSDMGQFPNLEKFFEPKNSLIKEI